MSGGHIHPDRLAEIRAIARVLRESGMIMGALIQELLDSHDAAWREIARLYEIESFECGCGHILHETDDGTIFVVAEFSSGKEFKERFRLRSKEESQGLEDRILDLQGRSTTEREAP